MVRITTVYRCVVFVALCFALLRCFIKCSFYDRLCLVVVCVVPVYYVMLCHFSLVRRILCDALLNVER